MHKYSKIGKYGSAIRHLKQNCIHNGMVCLPTIRFYGTVKLHGTNAGIKKDREGNISYQSRENVLSFDKDNAGFCNYMLNVESNYRAVSRLFDLLDLGDHEVTIYGEWAGKGIHKGVAINELAKGFYIFSVRVDKEGEEPMYLDMTKLAYTLQDQKHNIYNLWDDSMFPVFSQYIDLDDPEQSVDFLTRTTDYVENKCPVAKYFGVKGVGEGVVWHPDFDSGYFNGPQDAGAMFKVKGTKHSDNNTGKKLVQVDPEVLKGIKDFIDMTCTDHRLEKGLDFLKENQLELDISNTGKFVKWVQQDVLSEEQDTIVASGLDMERLPGAIAKYASQWYRNKL